MAIFYAMISFHEDSVNDAISAYDFLKKIQKCITKKRGVLIRI